MLLKFSWEYILHLVSELLTIVDIELVAAQFWVKRRELSHLKFKLNIACEEHKWFLNVGDMRVHHLVCSGDKFIYLQMKDVPLSYCMDSLFILFSETLYFLLNIDLDLL